MLSSIRSHTQVQIENDDQSLEHLHICLNLFICGKKEEIKKQHGSSGAKRQSQSREWTLHSDFKTCGPKSEFLPVQGAARYSEVTKG